MAHEHKKSEGGNKRGHSNMNHWIPTAEIKAAASVARRAATREVRYVGRRSMDVTDAGLKAMLCIDWINP